MEKGEPDEAIPHLRTVLKVNPNHPKAYYTLGNALSKKGKVDEAAASYQRALTLQPDFRMLIAISRICCLKRANSMRRWRIIERRWPFNQTTPARITTWPSVWYARANWNQRSLNSASLCELIRPIRMPNHSFAIFLREKRSRKRYAVRHADALRRTPFSTARLSRACKFVSLRGWRDRAAPAHCADLPRDRAYALQNCGEVCAD